MSELDKIQRNLINCEKITHVSFTLTLIYKNLFNDSFTLKFFQTEKRSLKRQEMMVRELQRRLGEV